MLYMSMGICESMSKKWNETRKEMLEVETEKDKEKLTKKLDKLTTECWFLRLYADRLMLNE